HGACVEQDDKGRDARKRAYCLKIQPATGSFARNLIYSTKPCSTTKVTFLSYHSRFTGISKKDTSLNGENTLGS
ncbi:hypothetical protein, partial [Klebsiella quasipneumoniae]|uniref:hypothetical protein n=1 Tax=Klebsiella quasipneumoniae TaxID=1463165 RepID=UPI001C49AAF3